MRITVGWAAALMQECPEQYKHSDLFDVAASNDSDKFILHVKDGKLH